MILTQVIKRSSVDILTKLKCKQQQMTQDKHRVIIPTKVHLEVNLVRDIKGNRKDFYRYSGRNMKTRENKGSMLNEEGTLCRTLKRLRYSVPSLPQSFLVKTGL